MLTVDEIQNVVFTRGRGYRTDEVDEFIDNCVETVQALMQENQTLNEKMKVLADKIVEYRNEEDNIRSALLNAQRTADSVLRDANARAEQILKDAETKARTIREDAKGAIAAENDELMRVRNEVTAFKARLTSIYKEHLTLINALPEEEKTVEPTVTETTAEQPPVSEPVEETVVPEPTEEVIVVPDSAEENPAAIADQDDDLKPVSKFANLKFGADYNIADDESDDEPAKRHNPFRKRK